MKLGLQIFSWVAVVLGVLALFQGLVSLGADPQSAYYSFLGGALFGVEGVLALIYIHSVDKLDVTR